MRYSKLDRMGRRRFIKAALAVGISVSSLKYGSQEALAARTDDDQVGYVRLMRTVDPGKDNERPPEREPIYGSIPRDEWERRHTCLDAAQRIGDRIRQWDRGSIDLIAPYFTEMDDDPSGFGVIVYYRRVEYSDGSRRSPGPSKEEVREYLPDTQQGEAGSGEHHTKRSHRVEVVDREEQEVGECQTDADNMDPNKWNNIPGGARVVNMTEDSFGTTCAPFHRNANNEKGVIISGHVANSTTDDIGQKDPTVGYNVQWGNVYDLHDGEDIDWGFVREIETDYGLSSNICNDDVVDDLDYPIQGIVTNDALQNEGYSKTYHTQGRDSLRRSGSMESFNYSSVLTEQQVDGGDSGGPLFYLEDVDSDGTQEAFITGVIVKQAGDILEDTDTCSDDTLSTTAEAVEDDANGAFY